MTTLNLKGGWSGAVHDPQRRFLGTVTASDLPTVKVGSAVEVHFESDVARVQRASTQGVYVLHTSKQRLTLAALTCDDAGAGGKDAQDDTRETSWTARVI